jgi:hypothetical protein
MKARVETWVERIQKIRRSSLKFPENHHDTVIANSERHATCRSQFLVLGLNPRRRHPTSVPANGYGTYVIMVSPQMADC